MTTHTTPQLPMSPLTFHGMSETRKVIESEVGSFMAISSAPFDEYDLRDLERLARPLRGMYQRTKLHRAAGDFK